MILRIPAALVIASALGAQPLEPVAGVELQPLAAATRRLVDALELAGAPLPAADRAALSRACEANDPKEGALAIQRVLDAHCLLAVRVNPESRVEVQRGPAAAQLVEHGWRTFLVKVHNEAGITARLRVASANAAEPFEQSDNAAEPPVSVRASDVRERFLELALLDRAPMRDSLSGLAVEYAILAAYSRDRGKREATIGFDVGQGTQDLGFRAATAVLFDCLPAVAVELAVADHGGGPAMAWFEIRDAQGRVHPAPSRRLAPDFFFHAQIYRGDGETVLLPPGNYRVRFGRGPEYLVGEREIVVPEAERHTERFALERWISAAALGWRSGDHHVHAAGCAHYASPTQGVEPADMWRHILGEDLEVACVLSWGPCWYHQKQFFDGRVHPLSTARNVMRYDVEVSGFPSSHAGHLCLLRLREDDYPGSARIDDWPSWNLPVLQWAKAQGAIVGYSHSGWGLEVPGDELPNWNMPRFDGIGANEYIVDVTHGAVDFISAVDTPVVWELSIWYHTLNCGFRTRISGETDFPCIYGERVGLGRSYVELGDGPLDYDAWVAGLRDGRSYVSDGASHLFDFAVGGVAVGEPGTDGAVSELALAQPDAVAIRARAAARLAAEPDAGLRALPLDEKPYWHLERARIGGARKVAVELVVNGEAVARQEIEADGRIAPVAFEHRFARSSWVALRIFSAAHTNPVFVTVGGAPIRASRRSAQWCLDAVDQCWKQKVGKIRDSEREAAAAAWEHARQTYRRIVRESGD
jgi:hypothetical protein